MQDYQIRVMEEQTQLTDRLVKLQQFIDGPVFPTLAPDEQSRLVRQESIMKLYAQVLAERIATFAKP